MKLPVFQHSYWPSWPLPMQLDLPQTPPHPCSYLPGQTRVDQAFITEVMDPIIYQQFMDAGFRRSGDIFYQPNCPGCRSCTPMRVPVKEFSPSKSQRKVIKKNADISVSFQEPEPTAEKHAMYIAYLESRHDTQQSKTYEDFISFLYTSPTQTIEMLYKDEKENTIGIGICDITPSALSTVYFYFDPRESKRSLGVYSSLYEIEFCRAHHLPYYYLGFYVEGCDNMTYKANYKPIEILCGDKQWRRVED